MNTSSQWLCYVHYMNISTTFIFFKIATECILQTFVTLPNPKKICSTVTSSSFNWPNMALLLTMWPEQTLLAQSMNWFLQGVGCWWCTPTLQSQWPSCALLQISAPQYHHSDTIANQDNHVQSRIFEVSFGVLGIHLWFWGNPIHI